MHATYQAGGVGSSVTIRRGPGDFEQPRARAADTARMRIDDHVRSFDATTLPADPFADTVPPDEAPTVRTSRFVENAPASADYGSMLGDATSTATLNRDRAVQQGLNELRDRFSGPYVVEGVSVSVSPMFRMNHPRSKEMTAAVWQAAVSSGVGNPNPIIWGQGTPSQLVKVTQALVDMGRLPPGPGDLASRIRQMQWEHGIGVDCAGYCREALIATTTKRLPLHGPGSESFRDLDTTRAGSFARQKISELRPGDLLTLDPIAPEVWGHNVIVYSRDTASEATKRSLAALHGDVMKAFLASNGPHHVIEVDSSWGAGATGADYGGFRRDTWIYDEATKAWGSFEPWAPRRFVVSPAGPSNDRFHGAYRAR